MPKTMRRHSSALWSGARLACAVACLALPAVGQGTQPQSWSEIMDLATTAQAAATPEQLLPLVPELALQEHPELHDLIMGAGGSIALAPETAASALERLDPLAPLARPDTDLVSTGFDIPACPSAGLDLVAGLPPPYGHYAASPLNNWCMPNSSNNGCSNVPDTGLTFDFRSACRQHDLAYRWVPTQRLSVDNRFLVDMGSDCNRRNFISRAICYTVAGLYYTGVRLFGGFVYGNSPTPGYDMEGKPLNFPPVTSCAQPSHAIFYSPAGTVVPRGTTVYMSGVVRPFSRVRYEFVDSAGTVAARHFTDFSRDNCVVHHEPEAFNTGLLSSGTYTVRATYMAWETEANVTADVATLQIYAQGTTTCGQPTHAYVYSPGGTTLQRGAIVYPTGVVRRYTPILFRFYDEAGNQVAAHQTQPARSNCVVHHEPEAFSTWSLPYGTIHSTATYTRWETDEVVTVPSTTLQILAPPPPPVCNPDDEASCWASGGSWNAADCTCSYCGDGICSAGEEGWCWNDCSQCQYNYCPY